MRNLAAFLKSRSLYSGLSLTLILILTACASHPTPQLTPMKKGDAQFGWSLELENVLPYAWYRWAASDNTNLGFRVGLPVYGSGIDISHVLYSKEKKWDALDLAWSLNPNKNIDLTYYKFYSREVKGNLTTYWWALRGMYIPKGISGGTSTRIGFLFGTYMGKRVGFELGYFHDFSSMPLLQVFNPSWKWDSPDNVARYGDTPHIDPASGMPSEYSRLTGISIQVFFRLQKKSNSDG